MKRKKTGGGGDDDSVAGWWSGVCRHFFFGESRHVSCHGGVQKCTYQKKFSFFLTSWQGEIKISFSFLPDWNKIGMFIDDGLLLMGFFSGGAGALDRIGF